MNEAPIKFWSFSALKDFEQCPYRVYLKRVERSPGPPQPDDNPLVRGTRVHKEAELYIQGEGEITRDLLKVKDVLAELREAYANGNVEVEEWWWADKQWQPVSSENPDRWVIVLCDVVHHLSDEHINVKDWKTGKSMGKELRHGEQGQLYALEAFMRYPNVRTVTVDMVYTDEKNKVKSRTFDRSQVAPLLGRWEKRANRLTTATHFPPKPNRSNCKYCDYGPSNGTGACPYGVEY